MWTPGPGNYSIEKVTSKGPAYSMSTKPNSKCDNWQPGPGNYDPNIDASKPDSHASAIGRGKRSNLSGGASLKIREPGPGAYNYINSGFTSSSYTIGNS